MLAWKRNSQQPAAKLVRFAQSARWACATRWRQALSSDPPQQPLPLISRHECIDLQIKPGYITLEGDSLEDSALCCKTSRAPKQYLRQHLHCSFAIISENSLLNQCSQPDKHLLEALAVFQPATAVPSTGRHQDDS